MLTLYAAIDQDDTNWIVVLKDVGPDVSVRTAREGERDVPRTCRSASSPAAGSRPLSGARPEALDAVEAFHKLTRARGR